MARKLLTHTFGLMGLARSEVVAKCFSVSGARQHRLQIGDDWDSPLQR